MSWDLLKSMPDQSAIAFPSLYILAYKMWRVSQADTCCKFGFDMIWLPSVQIVADCVSHCTGVTRCQAEKKKKLNLFLDSIGRLVICFL